MPVGERSDQAPVERRSYQLHRIGFKVRPLVCVVKVIFGQLRRSAISFMSKHRTTGDALQFLFVRFVAYRRFSWRENRWDFYAWSCRIRVKEINKNSSILHAGVRTRGNRPRRLARFISRLGMSGNIINSFWLKIHPQDSTTWHFGLRFEVTAFLRKQTGAQLWMHRVERVGGAEQI